MLFREWFAVFSALCFVASLFFMGIFSSNPSIPFCEPFPLEIIQVEVLGAVERPGVYQFEVGASVQSVLDRAGLKKTADRKAIYLKKRLLNSCSLSVPEKKCRKSKKKKQSSSSIALTSYAN